MLVVERARDLLGGDEATLLTYDETAGGLRVLADTHKPPFSRIVRVGEGTAGIAFQTGEPVAVENYAEWEHAVKDSIPRGLQSVVATPLMVRSRPIGALTVSFDVRRRLTGDELRLLALLATQVGPAIEAARLHDALVSVTHKLEGTNEALEEANRHKSIFLANMSHELRTPLNAIIGFSELLTDAREGQFDAATRNRFLNQILTSGRHLLGLINDILDLSKVEAGRMELKLEPVVAPDVVAQVLETCRPLAAKKNIDLSANAAASGIVPADVVRLKQMLLNLVSNAIKFTPDGGKVTITSKRTDHALELSVADNGIGISEADQAKLFQEFQQLNQGPGRRQEGTGLGLALTRRLARLHGGDVTVVSQPGGGSVFTIQIPIRQAVAGDSDVTGERPQVLVIEDEPAAGELLVRQLTRAGFKAHLLTDGLQAVETARRLQPSAITVDVLLPGIDGWEVIRRLKADEGTRSIPTLVVSVVDRPDIGWSLGVVDYFVKPFDPKDLIQRLQRIEATRTRREGPTRVLVVDDEAANREWLMQTLRPAGFDVQSASGGKEAIEQVRSSAPDLVLLDLKMPEVSGFDVVEALQNDERTRQTPIMVLTSADLDEIDRKQLSGRVEAILSRASTSGDDLVSVLTRLLPSPTP